MGRRLKIGVGVQSDSKATLLSEELRRYIDGRGLQPGFGLGTKASLGERYSVAPATLNEALRLLQAQDYVTVRPGRNGGIFVGQRRHRVSPASLLLAGQNHPQHVNDCVRVQDALQELMVSEAAAGFQPNKADELERIVRRLEAAADPRTIIELDWDMDRAIARVGNNRVLTQVYCAVIDTLQESVRWFDLDSEAVESSRQTHLQMAQAVMARDVRAAVIAAHRHSPDGYSGPEWRLIS